MALTVIVASGADQSQPVDLTSWQSVPYVAGRPATEQDVKEGRAVFVIPGSDAQPVNMSLPRCAICHDTKEHTDVPVICIQAESNGKAELVGFRLLRGGTGICTLSELTFLDGPDKRFTP